MTTNNHIFTLEEIALAYAKSAERLFGGDTEFLNSNQEVIPVFVNMLFQSLEISIKHAGVEAKLFTLKEVRKRQHRSGHGIKEIATLAVEKLGGDPFTSIITAMTFSCTNQHAENIIRQMVCGEDFEKTRNVYATRYLGYGQIKNGDFSLITPIEDWVESVKQTALNLPKTIDILTQWKQSESDSKHFAIWYDENK